MKKYISYFLLLSTIFLACKKDSITLYESNVDNVFLNYLDDDGVQDTASITYSFAASPGLAADTMWIPVSISGKRISKDRKFALAIVDSLTTARVNLHYEALKPFYIMPADSGKLLVPLIIKNIDEELTNSSVILAIRAVATDELKAELPVAIRTKRFIYSNRLEQPWWWMYWQGNLGPYSRTSHRLFLIAGGQDLVNPGAPDGYLGIPRTLYYLDNAKNLTKDPFTWITRNAEKGYVLTKRTDGTEDYDFYHKDAPSIKIHLKFFPQVNSHFFISENGSQIIMN